MSSALVLTFPDGVTEAQYHAVNEKLGLDMGAGTGDFPDGMIRHTAGPTPSGGWVVTEVWQSEDHQARFMQSRLGPVLHEVGVPEPSSVTWFTVIADRTP